jgi:hypothetical protein
MSWLLLKLIVVKGESRRDAELCRPGCRSRVVKRPWFVSDRWRIEKGGMSRCKPFTHDAADVPVALAGSNRYLDVARERMIYSRDANPRTSRRSRAAVMAVAL